MKRKKLLFLSLLMAVVMTAALVGCGCNVNSDNSGNPGTSDNGNTEEQFEYDSYLVKHAENSSATYCFEAECTDLGNKSGPAWSGSYTEAGMIVACNEASGGYAVQGLAKLGNSVNFLVVCDRDVEDAKLVLQLANPTKYEVNLDSSMYTIRVDTIVTSDDLKPASEDGAIGNWDKAFLNYYQDLNQTGGYYIEQWDCGTITFKAPEFFTAGDVYMGDSKGYAITTALRLKKGVNCISLITNNTEQLIGTTMTSTAPAVDCIEITTTAQLGMYYKNNNGGYNVTACKIK